MLAINQFAETQADRDGVDAGVGFPQPANVPQSEFDLRFEFTGPLQHWLREVNADHAAARPGKRKQLVSQFPGAGAEVQDSLAWVQVGPFCGPGAPDTGAGHAVETSPGGAGGRGSVDPQ